MLKGLVFFHTYGGISQDSAWFYSTSHNLALHGKYASSLVPIDSNYTPQKQDCINDIFATCALIDEHGFNWFDLHATVGPVHTLAAAITVFIFGSNRFSAALIPFMVMTLLFMLVLGLTAKHFGKLACFCVFLCFYTLPQIYMEYIYQNYAESTGLLFFLLALLFYKKNQLNLSSLFLSFAVLCKVIYFIPASGFLVAVFLKKPLKASFKYLTFFLISPVSWLLIKIIIIINIFSFQAVKTYFSASLLKFSYGGSGTSTFNHFDLEKIFKQIQTNITVSYDLGVYSILVFWLAIAFVLYKKQDTLKKIFCLNTLYLSHFFYIAWFIILNKTGWFRHLWGPMFFAWCLFGIFLSLLIHALFDPSKKPLSARLIALAALVLIGFNLDYPTYSHTFNISQKKFELWHVKRHSARPKGGIGLPVNHILNWKPQSEVADFIKQELPEKSIFYFYSYYYGLEALTFIDFMPHSFYFFQKTDTSIDLKQNAYLIFPPYNNNYTLFSSVDFIAEDHNEPYSLCKTMIYSRPSYSICKL